MGLDQRIWAALEVEGITKQVAIHYWRKNYAIDEWFLSRLPKDVQQEIDAEGSTMWSCDLTMAELELLEADEYALALEVHFGLELIGRCEQALKAGFRLNYRRDG